ncbi:MAG TPA: YciI family protein [Pseudomonadales bacterium]
MKVVVFVKATKNSEAGVMPTTELITAMMNYNEELVKAGIMQGGDGLKPSSKGARIRFDGDSRTVMNGPFAETSELVAGYWLWDVKDMAEAIAWAKRCPSPMPGEVSELEIRPVYGPEDFGEAFTPELRDKYDALVEQEQAQKR